MISGIVATGAALITPALIGSCAQSAITLTLLDRLGRFQTRIEGPLSGNVLLRRAQYRCADSPDQMSDIVRAFLLGKISNQRQVILRARRDLETDDNTAQSTLSDIAQRLAHILHALEQESAIDIMRGLEGEASRIYFSAFPILIRSPDPELQWHGRSRRPPLDRFNALLSFLYTLLTHECRSAAESVGLDPAVGFLHRDRPGRPSLALDLMEELRPVLCDRLALSLVNRRQLRSGDFKLHDNGAISLVDDARKTVLTAWQERKRDERLHPFLNEKAALGLVPFLQAQMLSRHLRGDIDAYPPWFWR